MELDKDLRSRQETRDLVNKAKAAADVLSTWDQAQIDRVVKAISDAGLCHARELAEKTVRLFGQDLESCGSLHEFYHPDTGEPIMTHGFQNWNFLVLNMIAYLEDRPMATEF